MLYRTAWMKRSLLLSASLVGLLLCTGCDETTDAIGDGFGDETVVGGGNGFPTNPDPDLGGMGTEVGAVDEETTRAGQVTEKITALKAKYHVDIRGDWTPESLGVLEDVLKVYDPDPSVLANLAGFKMFDKKDATVGNNRRLATFFGGACQTPGVTPSQCLNDPSIENNPLGGVISIYGNSLDSTLGAQQVAVDTIQHELGHFFSVAIAKDQAWRTEWRDEGLMQMSVSSYGNSTTEEHYAELWSKMYTQREKSLGDVEWSSAGTHPLPEFLRRGITAKLNTIAQKVVSTSVRSGLVH